MLVSTFGGLIYWWTDIPIGGLLYGPKSLFVRNNILQATSEIWRGLN